jgi:hypothetical protein
MDGAGDRRDEAAGNTASGTDTNNAEAEVEVEAEAEARRLSSLRVAVTEYCRAVVCDPDAVVATIENNGKWH